MTSPALEAQSFIARHLENLCQRKGVPVPALGPEVHLLEDGLLDSLELIELLGAAEERFGVELDLEAVEPEELGTLGGLVAVLVASDKRM